MALLSFQVMLIGLLLFFATNSINLIYTTAPSYAKEYNVSQSEVTDIMLYTAIGEIGMRVFHGWFADRGIITALSQICIMMVVCTIGAVLSSSLPGVAGKMYIGVVLFKGVKPLNSTGDQKLNENNIYKNQYQTNVWLCSSKLEMARQ